MPNLPCDEGVMRGGVAAPKKTQGGMWVLAATIPGSSMVFIDGTVVNVALPALQKAGGLDRTMIFKPKSTRRFKLKA